MFKLKNLNLFINNFNIIYVYSLIRINNYIIFFNLINMSNNVLLNLKNELKKANCFSLVLNSTFINIVFSNNFKFLCASIFSIYISCYLQFLKIVHLLNNIYIYFALKKKMSNIVLNNILLDINIKYQTFNCSHLYFNLIFNNILLFILYYIILLLQYTILR